MSRESGFEPHCVPVLHDLACVGQDAAVQNGHLLGTQASAPLILPGKAGEDFSIGTGEPDAIALQGGVPRLFVGNLVLIDAQKSAQSPAVVADESEAELFDECFLAHGVEGWKAAHADRLLASSP